MKILERVWAEWWGVAEEWVLAEFEGVGGTYLMITRATHLSVGFARHSGFDTKYMRSMWNKIKKTGKVKA